MNRVHIWSEKHAMINICWQHSGTLLMKRARTIVQQTASASSFSSKGALLERIASCIVLVKKHVDQMVMDGHIQKKEVVQVLF